MPEQISDNSSNEQTSRSFRIPSRPSGSLSQNGSDVQREDSVQRSSQEASAQADETLVLSSQQTSRTSTGSLTSPRSITDRWPQPDAMAYLNDDGNQATAKLTPIKRQSAQDSAPANRQSLSKNIDEEKSVQETVGPDPTARESLVPSSQQSVTGTKIDEAQAIPQSVAFPELTASSEQASTDGEQTPANPATASGEEPGAAPAEVPQAIEPEPASDLPQSLAQAAVLSKETNQESSTIADGQKGNGIVMDNARNTIPDTTPAAEKVAEGSSSQNLPAPSIFKAEEKPVPVAPKKRNRRPLAIALALLAVLIVVTGLLGQHLFLQPEGAPATKSITPFSYPASGPYAQFPLSASEINNIQHLSGHMKYKALASLYVSHMNLDDKIGQLIMLEYTGASDHGESSYTSDLDYAIGTLHVGGMIMYEFQMATAQQTKDDIAKMQARANIPLLVSTDEEGGPYVHRVSRIYGNRMSATDIENTGDINVATQQGLKTSQDLAALGINEDLAPDVDVNQVNGYDMVTRTFGNTPDDVIKYAGAYLQAMQGNGTVACIKHFPGLGGALTDAHKELPVVNSTRQQIYDIDLAPFKAFIQSQNALQNPGMIMPTDVLLPAIDPTYPAELSHTFMTDILRNELGYDGVVLTDALYMQGITKTWDMYTASVMALQAGNDMLLGANDSAQAIGTINAIKQALQNGTLTEARINESVTRILALKMQYHLMPTYVPGM